VLADLDATITSDNDSNSQSSRGGTGSGSLLGGQQGGTPNVGGGPPGS